MRAKKGKSRTITAATMKYKVELSVRVQDMHKYPDITEESQYRRLLFEIVLKAPLEELAKVFKMQQETRKNFHGNEIIFQAELNTPELNKPDYLIPNIIPKDAEI